MATTQADATLTTVAATTPAAPTMTPRPLSASQQKVIAHTSLVDANLRAGPGTEFAVIGGTITGMALTIVGRNADGTWFRLDNTGWLFGKLVNNLPPLETIPVVNADGTPVEVPVPLAAHPTPPDTTSASATIVTTDYPEAALRVVGQYDSILLSLDELMAQARSDSTILADATWGTRVNGTVTLLRQVSATVGELQPPAELETVQQDLLATAQQYITAANALAQAVTTGDVTQLDKADAAMQLGSASLTKAETALKVDLH